MTFFGLSRKRPAPDDAQKKPDDPPPAKVRRLRPVDQTHGTVLWQRGQDTLSETQKAAPNSETLPETDDPT
jgi:hypothetical protein